MEYLVPASLLAEPDVAERRHDVVDGLAEAEALAELRDELAEAKADAAAAKGELVAELRRSHDLAAALSKAESRAERLEGELAEVRKRAEAALAEARRPWLARVLEGLRRR
jgi:predicted  nucleic acid-binding Zn-ribbon protein